ncbi:hypothetical protein TIFTF001_008365 [Ficus carica]|uniref:Uncharacterized protein n=1 Tax=Ficus carica TaxID=3494 RepID=A0AA87ZSX1_FICCA|nr:hypothetical protein TIFTF001_008365 [Ficus carica]
MPMNTMGGATRDWGFIVVETKFGGWDLATGGVGGGRVRLQAERGGDCRCQGGWVVVSIGNGIVKTGDHP